MFNLDDPKNQALIAMGLGLLGGAPRQNKNFGADLAHGGLLGLQAYAGAKQAQQREQKEAQQRQMREMQMAEMQRAIQQRGQISDLARSSFAPPQPLDPRQQEGGQQMAPGGGGMEAFARGMMQIDPAQGMQLMPKPRGPVVLSKGAALMDPQTGARIADNPDVPDWMNPQYVDVQKQIRASGRPQVITNVDTRQETEFAKSLGKQQGEDYANLMKGDMAASSKLNKLGRLESLLGSSGNTGKLTPATMELKAAAESLGFKVDPKLPFQQAAQALSNEIALELRNPAGGAGMPGALSDRDREFLVNMVPNLGKTPEGNKMLIDTMRKLAKREKDVARLAREYRKKTGKFDEGFYEVLSQFSAQNPLFPQAPASDGWSVERLP